LPQLKQLLGTEADITVSRKLKELSYRTSYSHRGSFYTLDEIASFDELGLVESLLVPLSASTSTLGRTEKVTMHGKGVSTS